MILIVGLGNPGNKYDNTWHNLGFMAIDKIARRIGIDFKSGRGEYLTAVGFLNSHKVILIKPTTYMNLSGRAVVQALQFYSIEKNNLIVLYDDVTISLGNVRFRGTGSAGGHNGIKSLISVLQTQEFKRVRIGFRNDRIEEILKNNPAALPDVVLGQIPKSLQTQIEDSIGLSADCLEYYLDKGLDETMNKFNKKEEIQT